MLHCCHFKISSPTFAYSVNKLTSEKYNLTILKVNTLMDCTLQNFSFRFIKFLPVFFNLVKNIESIVKSRAQLVIFAQFPCSQELVCYCFAFSNDFSNSQISNWIKVSHKVNKRVKLHTSYFTRANYTPILYVFAKYVESGKKLSTWLPDFTWLYCF